MFEITVMKKPYRGADVEVIDSIRTDKTDMPTVKRQATKLLKPFAYGNTVEGTWGKNFAGNWKRHESDYGGSGYFVEISEVKPEPEFVNTVEGDTLKPDTAPEITEMNNYESRSNNWIEDMKSKGFAKGFYADEVTKQFEHGHIIVSYNDLPDTQNMVDVIVYKKDALRFVVKGKAELDKVIERAIKRLEKLFNTPHLDLPKTGKKVRKDYGLAVVETTVETEFVNTVEGDTLKPDTEVTETVKKAETLDEAVMNARAIKKTNPELAITAKVHGDWLWISGETFKVKNDFKASGFFWARKKQMWYWKPSSYKRRRFKGAREFSIDQIIAEHGETEVDITTNALANTSA